MNVNYLVAKQLYELGFTYQYYENNIETGMVFSDGETEYIIGGDPAKSISNTDMEKIKDFIWLPSVGHLIEWLKENDFIFTISCENVFFDIRCQDIITQREYHTKVPTLDYALAVIIKKILKKKERDFDYFQKTVYIIDEE